MINSLIGSIPKHRYVWVDTKYSHNNPIGFQRAVWFGLVSFPNRTWGCNVMFENGAVYRSLPPNAISFKERPVENKWETDDAQLWDCYGYDWTTVEYTYLRDLRCKCFIKDKAFYGNYLFTVAPINDGFSEAPEQSKEFMFIELENGRLTIQPTNRLIFEEKSFTVEPENKIDLKLQTEIYYCE